MCIESNRSMRGGRAPSLAMRVSNRHKILRFLCVAAAMLPAAAVSQGVWLSSSHQGWNFTHNTESFALSSPCFKASQVNPASESGQTWMLISFSLAPQPPLATNRIWTASLNCSQSGTDALECVLRCSRSVQAGSSLSWSAQLSFTRGAVGSSVLSSVGCSALDTGAYAFADPQRYISFSASAGNVTMGLSCSKVLHPRPPSISSTSTTPLPSHLHSPHNSVAGCSVRLCCRH